MKNYVAESNPNPILGLVSRFLLKQHKFYSDLRSENTSDSVDKHCLEGMCFVKYKVGWKVGHDVTLCPS